MSKGELIFLAMGGSVLTIVAIVAVLMFALMLHGQLRLGRYFVPMTFVCCTIGMALAVVLSHRDVRFAAFGTDNIGADAGGAAWPTRLLTGLMLGMSLAALFNRYFRTRRLQLPGDAPVNAAQRRFAEAFVLYFAATYIVPSVLGAKPSFTMNVYYALPVFLAAIVDGVHSFDRVLRWAKFSLLGMTLGSLVAMAVQPSLALQPGYAGWVPGLSIRLWGIGSSPNSIGPLALLSLLLEYIAPTRDRRLRWLLVGCGLATLVLAQSKTAWMATLVAGTCVSLFRFGLDRQGRLRFGTVIFVTALLSLLLIGMLIVPPQKLMAAVSETKAGSELVTLTGRSQIWNVAIDVWLEHPLFGYGPTIWDPAFRASLGMPFATHAHNQWLQSLSQGGAFSALALLLYLVVMIIGCIRMTRPTRGASLAILIFVLIRSMTETPLTVSTLFNGEMFTHMLLAVIAARGLSLPRTVPASRIASAVIAPAAVDRTSPLARI
ncbi:O-antigen ligase family protein [Sphaerotilus uruguayifluvii]|uniref:O-antigen ligase n=1 Tax=Sphaerotilus uruguayifluvii TaxID=2735897 RepID=A0ABX2GA37_9BURK|nr:O-antigen ligase family protein [Leptothrix sp. C29]NRT58340.1 O-antigen ligase [Leptothrix sp. C29]